MNLSVFLQARPNVLLFKYGPLWLSVRYLRLLGWAYFLLNPRERDRIRRNIMSVFPEGEQSDRIVRKTFDGIFAHYSEKLIMAHRNYARLKLELAAMLDYQGTEHLDRALGNGGAILVTGHFGGVEFMPLALALRGYAVTMVVKFKTEVLKRNLLARAEEVNVELIDAEEGDVLRQAVDAVHRGRILLTECDEVESWKTSATKTIEAFGGRIFQDRTLDILCRRCRTTVLSCFMIRTARGYRLDIESLEPAAAEPDVEPIAACAADPDTVLTVLSAESAPGISARVLKKFEKLVMTFPDQWYEWRKFHMMRAGVA